MNTTRGLERFQDAFPIRGFASSVLFFGIGFLFQLSAYAETFKATLEGVVEIGSDIQGVFGIPGGASYAGMPFKATWTLDTSQVSSADLCENVIEQGCYGSHGSGQAAPIFIKDISLIINGITRTWPNPSQATQILRLANYESGLDEYEMISGFAHESGYSVYTSAYIADETGTMLSTTLLSQIVGPIDINLPDGAYWRGGGLNGLEFHLPVPCVIDEGHCSSTNHDLLIIISQPWLFSKFSVVELLKSTQVPLPNYAIALLAFTLVVVVNTFYSRTTI